MENLIEELTKVNPANLSEEGLKLFNTIMLVIDDRDKLIKENKKLNNANKTYINCIQNITPVLTTDYIEKSLIKEKIEELNSRIEKYREYVEQGIETDVEWVDNVADRETIKVLEELLGEEK